MKHLFTLGLLLGLITFPAISDANVGVGDSPTLQFDSANNKGAISLAKLKGHMVIVDFWATWCGPCMNEADHMVQINSKYQPKGLSMIGISLDQDRGAMLSTAHDKGFTWPQYFDGLVWKNHFAQLWGVNSIPRTFLISPDGEVLWTGHPAEIDPVLEEAFKNHPPHLLDDKATASAGASLDEIDAALKDNKFTDALAAYTKLPADTGSEPSLADRFASLTKQLNDAGDKMLGDAQALIDQKKYADAIPILRNLSKTSALSASAPAAKLLASIQSNPAAKAQLDALAKADQQQRLAATAADRLTAAQKLQFDGKADEAYAQFKSIATTFPNTPAAATAAAEAAKMESDPAFTAKAAAVKATPMLRLADSYKAAGRNDLARAKYQAVIDQFPNTPAAETAKKALADLSG